MVKRIFIALAILILLMTAGCSLGNTTATTTGTATQPANVKQIRQFDLAGTWTVNQIEINLESATPILLKLKEGDKVEGYYYLVKGDNIDFQVSGQSLIYRSNPVAGQAQTVTSDRFSFTASGGQGIAYTLTFSPVKTNTTATATVKTSATVFLELIYPKTGEIFYPAGTK